jgi:hypothetical protein
MSLTAEIGERALATFDDRLAQPSSEPPLAAKVYTCSWRCLKRVDADDV